jgi:hypothetical protein
MHKKVGAMRNRIVLINDGNTAAKERKQSIIDQSAPESRSFYGFEASSQWAEFT